MSKSTLTRPLILVLGLLILGLVVLISILHKDVTLIIDGNSSTISTYALTVGGVLRSEDIPLTDGDELIPPAKTLIDHDTIISLNHAFPVQVLADGMIVDIHSPKRTAGEWLSSAGLTLHPGDVLLAEGIPVQPEFPFEASIQSASLQIIRSASVNLYQDVQQQTVQSVAPTIGQALWESGIVLQIADHLQPPSDTPMQGEMDAHLQRAQPLTILTVNGEVQALTAAQTVGEALTDAGVALQGLDYSDPSPDQPLPADLKVRLVRVAEEVIIENTPLAFETAYEAAPELELDQQSILQTGEFGLTAQRIRIHYEDGQEISRQTEAEWTARQPKPRIMGYGTKIIKHALDTPDGTIYYYRALTMWATSYRPADVGGNTQTASGKTLRKGLVAINPYYIPYGTYMYVPGYGHAEAADTGLLGPRMIDLGYSDDDYVSWHQYVTVYFLWPPPDQILWIYP